MCEPVQNAGFASKVTQPLQPMKPDRDSVMSGLLNVNDLPKQSLQNGANQHVPQEERATWYDGRHHPVKASMHHGGREPAKVSLHDGGRRRVKAKLHHGRHQPAKVELHHGGRQPAKASLHHGGHHEVANAKLHHGRS